MSTTKKKNRKKVAAIVLVGLGVAALGTASASTMTVNSRDDVASGTAGTPVVGLEGATATVRTVVRDATTVPDTTGAVPVDLQIRLDPGTADGALADKTGTVFVNGTPYTFDVDDAATTAGYTIAGSSLTSHDALGTVGVVVSG